MKAMTKQILNDIKYKGKVPMMIEAVDRVLIMDRVSKHRVSGYVCGIIGDYRSKFKQVSIQKTQNGKKFIMADRIRFNVEEMKPCAIDTEIIERELALSVSLKNTFLDMKNRGEEVGYLIENQEFCIKNLTEYLNGGM